MSAIWHDAIHILETASAVRDENPSEIAILIDDRNGMRVVDAAGWNLDALKFEYAAQTAYTISRTAASVVVQASSGSDQVTLKKKLIANPLASLAQSIPHHLIRPQQPLLS